MSATGAFEVGGEASGVPPTGGNSAGAVPGADWGTGSAPVDLAGSLDEVLSTSDDPRDRQSEDRLSTGQMDALLVELQQLRARIERPLSRIAALFVRERAWRALGHARQEDYARNRLESTGRWLRQTSALGEALARFPALDAALTGADGGRPLGRGAVLQIAGVATYQDVELWIGRAREVSLRQLTVDVQRARGEDVLGDVPRRGGTREHRAATPPWERPHPASEEGRAEEDAHSDETAQEGASDGETRGAGTADGDSQSTLGAEADTGHSPTQKESVPTIDVAISCPAEVVAAFEEALDLHRAVCGKEATIASFAEALAAEAGAGPDGPAEDTSQIEHDGWDDGVLRDPQLRRRRPPHPTWMNETDPETRARRCRAEAPWAAPFIEELATLATDVFRLERDAEEAADRLAPRDGGDGPSEPVDAHRLEGHIRRAGRLELALERATARLLAAVQRARPWGVSGTKCLETPDEDEGPTWAVSLGQYASERLGISATRARELARAAHRLRAFPILQSSWIDGQLATDKVLTLLPLLGHGPIDASLEESWDQHAREVTIRRLKDEVRELRGRARARPRMAPSPRPMADEDWHRSLRRQPGRTLGRLERLDEHLKDDQALPRNLLRLVLPYQLGLSLLAALHAAGSRRTFSDSENGSKRGSPGRRAAPPYWRELMDLLLDYARTWDPPEEGAAQRPRQADIYERDGYRCAAPDCTSRAHLEAHHLRFRSDGGSDEPSNLATLCAYHHRQGVHDKGTLVIEGHAPDHLVCTLGKADRARTYVNDRRVS